MAQFLRPDSNITQTSFTGGFSAIDETPFSDADFAYGANNTAAVLEVGLSNPAATPDSAGVTTVRYRIAKTNNGTVDAGGNAVTVTAAVYQGGTLISSDAAQTATGTWTPYSWTPDMSAVTDWTDVRLRFTTSASGGSPANRRGGAVSFAELEAPNAAAAAYILDASPGTLALSGASATLLRSVILDAQPGSLTITGFSADLSVTSALQNYVLDAQPGTLSITGTNAELLLDAVLIAQPGTLALAGSDAEFLRSIILDAQPGTLTITGSNAELIYTAASAVLDAQPGVLSISGASAELLRSYVMDAQPGTLTLTGADATLVREYTLAAQPKTLTIVGYSATMTKVGMVWPDPADVRAGVEYGPTGIEYVGTMVGGVRIDISTGARIKSVGARGGFIH